MQKPNNVSYHIFLVTQNNFEDCIKSGIYGNLEHPNPKTNAEIIATTLTIKDGDL